MNEYPKTYPAVLFMIAFILFLAYFGSVSPVAQMFDQFYDLGGWSGGMLVGALIATTLGLIFIMGIEINAPNIILYGGTWILGGVLWVSFPH